MHLYHFHFNFILIVGPGLAIFDFNQFSIFTEYCFWPWKRFKWSKSLLLRFPPSYNLNPPSKISPTPIWKTLVRGMQGHASSHGSSAIHNIIFLLIFFFLIGIYPMQDWTATTRHGDTRKKKAQKRLHDTENLFRKNLQLKDVC